MSQQSQPMYGPEIRADLLEQLQSLPEGWVWQRFGNGTVVCEGRAENGQLAAFVSAMAHDPRDPKLRKMFAFTDEDLEPFRKAAKLCGYESVEHALSHFLETKAYRKESQCPALP